MSTNFSTRGSVARGATVLVASGIIAAVQGDFPFSILARHGSTPSGGGPGAEGSFLT
jgi:hypothetical protein